LYGIQKLANGDIKTYKYSSNEYYCHSGKFKADTRRAYWNSEVRDIQDVLSGVSPKNFQAKDLDSLTLAEVPSTKLV
jgi:hypothetical protein